MDTSGFYASPFGMLEITEDGRGITGIRLIRESKGRDFTEGKTPLIQKAVSQLDAYFSGALQDFDLPLSLKGTEFQKTVWEALRRIPYGETRSYKQVAESIGNPKACRAVGMANNRNPVLIVVPCHRVIGQNGSMVGYACGLEVKEFLLDLERKNRHYGVYGA